MAVISMEGSRINSNSTSITTPTQNNHNHNYSPTLSESSLYRFIQQLQSDYPEFIIKTGHRFKFRPPRTIILSPEETSSLPQTNDNPLHINQNYALPLQYFGLLSLHELGHALCKHKDYNVSIERLKIESEAWQMAKTVLATHSEYQKIFGITYDEDFAESQLDTYRDWLHTRSRCPSCGLTRYQTPDHLWHCPLCNP